MMADNGVTRKRARGPGVCGVLATGGMVIAVAACGGARGEDATQDQAESVGYTRVVNVEVEPVEPREFTRIIRVTGVAQAMRDVMVSAQEEGVVRRIVRDKGQPIRAGQAILRLDDAILRAQVQTAAAQAGLADELWERRKKLYEEDGIGSEVSYLEAKYVAEQNRGNLTALQERLARTTITAPISGILDARIVEVGSMVSPGTPVARIVQTDSIKILAGVPERYALDLSVGAAVSVVFDVLVGEVLGASITYVGVAVDPDSRTFPVELTLPNPGRRIKPEMVASVAVVQEELSDAIVVPQQVLVAMEEGHVVFVVEGTGEETVAVARQVRISTSQGNEAVIDAGLEVGDRVVVTGQQGLTAGDRVRIVPRGAGEEG